MGAEGAYYCDRIDKGYVNGFQVDAMDMTGCGDVFWGAVLYNLACNKDIPLRQTVRYANAAGALCATKTGGFQPGLKISEMNKILNL